MIRYTQPRTVIDDNGSGTPDYAIICDLDRMEIKICWFLYLVIPR